MLVTVVLLMGDNSRLTFAKFSTGLFVMVLAFVFMGADRGVGTAIDCGIVICCGCVSWVVAVVEA